MTSFADEHLSNHWWVQIKTTIPLCQYYFGPFVSIKEAEAHQAGYVEDLVGENALEIVVSIIHGQPEYLTLCDEEERHISPMFDHVGHHLPHTYPTVLNRSSKKNRIPQ